MANSKLRNTEAVHKLLEGTHKSQTRKTIGWTNSERNKKREVGEVWEEVGPGGHVTVWEQKKGYRIKTSKAAKIVQEAIGEVENYKKCFKDCKTTNYSRLDKKFNNTHQMCFDCVLRIETKLKCQGKEVFEEYAKTRMLANAKGFLKDARAEKEAIKESMIGMEQIYVDGRSERWEHSNKQSIIDKVDSDFEKLEKDLIKSFE